MDIKKDIKSGDFWGPPRGPAGPLGPKGPRNLPLEQSRKSSYHGVVHCMKGDLNRSQLLFSRRPRKLMLHFTPIYLYEYFVFMYVPGPRIKK